LVLYHAEMDTTGSTGKLTVFFKLVRFQKCLKPTEDGVIV